MNQTLTPLTSTGPRHGSPRPCRSQRLCRSCSWPWISKAGSFWSSKTSTEECLAQPWQLDELHRVLGAANELSVLLDPSPIAAPPVADRFGEKFQGWRRLSAASADGTDDLAWLDPWARRNLGRLVDREAAWIAAAAGSALIHGDLRADNVLLTDDRVMVVDWPWAAVGASWFDVVAMGPSVIMQGAPDAVSLLDQHLFARGADPEDVTTVLIAAAGYFLRQSVQAPPPGLPTVRDFQRAQGQAALHWVRERTHWR
ncbi:phosphotransferase [Streptomyces parvus]